MQQQHPYEAGESATPPTNSPTFSLSSGTYSGTQTVTLHGPSKAKIYYTTDGSQPTTASALYSTAISVSQTATITAIAVAPASLVSGPVADTYTIAP